MSNNTDLSKETSDTNEIQVLKFSIGSEIFCVDINYISEIVESKDTDTTRIPNSSPEVNGVMDLRGKTTTILNPKIIFNVEQTDDLESNFVIVFNEESNTSKGWEVDEVYNVTTISTEDIDTNITKDQDNVNGIIQLDDSFVIFVEPKHLN